MLIDERNMKADGLTDAEVQRIVGRVNDALERGRLDQRPALLFSVETDPKPQLVCVEYAEALERTRPSFWHVILANGHHPNSGARQARRRFKQKKRPARSIDDLFDLNQLRRHPPTVERCWVCGERWQKHVPTDLQRARLAGSGFPEYPVIVVPILAHLQRIAEGVDGIPEEIAVCFGCFNEYATIYHQVIADDVDPSLDMTA